MATLFLCISSWTLAIPPEKIIATAETESVPTAANGSVFFTPEKHQWLSEHERQIRIGITVIPPQRLYIGEEYKGLCIEYIRLIEQKLGCRFTLVPDELTGLIKLSLGKVDAMVIEISRASYYIEQEGILNLRATGDAGLLYANRSDWPMLHEILNKGLSAVSKQEKHEISRRWIIAESKSIFGNRKFLISVAVAAGSVLLAIAAMVVWNYSLRTRVRHRTSQLHKKLAERNKSEEQLRTSENKYKSLIRKVQTAIVVHDGQGRIVDSNPLAHRLLGLSEDQLLGKSLIDPEWHFLRENGSVMPVEEYPVSLVLSKREPLRNYVTGIRCPGRENVTWALVNADPEYDDTRQITQVIVSFIDITERKQAAQNLSLMNFAMNQVCEAVFLIDENACFHFVNEEACRILGYTREELLDMSVSDVDPDFPSERWPEHWNELKTQHSLRFEGRHQSRDGTIFPVEINANYIEYAGMAYNLALVRDISERKWAEEQLRRREKQYRTLVDNIPASISRFDTDLRVLFLNAFGERTFGVPQEEFVGKIFAEEAGPASDEENLILAQSIRRVFEQGTIERMEACWQTVTGDRIFEILHVPECDENGTVVSVLGIAYDITDRKQHEAVNAMRLHLIQFSFTHSLNELLEEALNETEKLTDSLVSFFHFLESDQKTLSLQEWSTRTKTTFCKAEGKGMHYPIEQAGVWVDCVHQRKAVIHNDFASLPHRKGMPEGHAPLIRELVVPVFRGEKIVAILGIGNKPTDYTEKDVEIVSLIADQTWEIAERKRAEKAEHESEQRFHQIFEDSPVSIWEEDFSEVKFVLDNLRMEGVTDIDTYFAENPETVQQCAELIKIVDVNRATLVLHGATKEQLLAGIVKTFTPDSFETFRQELICLWNGETEMVSDSVIKTLAGEPRNITVYFAVCPGYEKTFSKILISIIDITERKQTEEKLQENLNELQRWYDITLNREERVQELKQEVNQLLRRLEEPARYESQTE